MAKLPALDDPEGERIPDHLRVIDAHVHLFPDGLYLDTTMMLAGYFDTAPRAELITDHADRILYGTDFPNIPYAWDRELKAIEAMPLSTAARRAILSGNAERVFWGEPDSAPVLSEGSERRVS